MIWLLANIAVSYLLISEDSLFVGGASFSYPTVDAPLTYRPIYGVKGQTKELRWAYTIESGEALVRLDCGHGASMSPMVSLTNQGSEVLGSAGNLNKIAITRGNQPQPGLSTDIAFNIKQVDDNDRKVYYCNLQWTLGGVHQPVKTSNRYSFQILEKPRFIPCLRMINEVQAPVQTIAGNDIFITPHYTVDEGGNVSSVCNVFGVPKPFLICRVYERQLNAVNDILVDSQPGTAQQRNLTFGFKPARKTYTKVVCRAEGGVVNSGNYAGVQQITRMITVYYRPNPIRNLAVSRSTTNSITVKWDLPRPVNGKNVGNLPYKAIYFEIKKVADVSYTGVNMTTDVQALPIVYAFESLEAGAAYDIQVRLYNRMGGSEVYDDVRCVTEGTCLKNQEAKDYVAPDSNERTGDSNGSKSLIIGLAVGGAVILVIIIVVVVLCYRKRQEGGQKYPTSYVEEAVDYPAGPKLYSQVDKSAKKNLNEDQRSTSGYPDVIHQTKEPGVRYTAVSNRDSEVEESRQDNRSLASKASKASTAQRGPPQNEYDTSPSYEDSRKEYV